MMMEITQEQINTAIKECIWRKEFDEVSVCGGMVAPCSRIIEKGQCDTLIKLFAMEGTDECLTTE